MTIGYWKMENKNGPSLGIANPSTRFARRPNFTAKKTNGRETLASVPSVFLRPFSGCVPQPEKKRRLFDSHNPNSLMVAELRATISKVPGAENQASLEKQNKVPPMRAANFGFPFRMISSIIGPFLRRPDS
jgi:hypothetical protein